MVGVMVTFLSSTISIAVLIHLSWSSVTAAAFLDFPLNSFFPRDSSVATCAANYNSCGSSYAGSFCCSSETTCLPLDSGSSVLCCPTGSNCTFIEPITCNIQALNATANPTAPIQSTRLTDNLPTCADGCCPFGYTCAKNTTCVLDASTSNTGGSNSLSGSATGTAATATTATQTNVAATSTLSIGDTSPATSKTSAGSLAATSTTTASTAFSSNSAQAEAATKCSQFPATAVVAGFFPGALTGALVAAMIMMCRRRGGDHRNREIIPQKTRRSSGGEIVGISDPIPDDENGSFRTDFLLQRKLSGRYPTPGTVSRSKSMMRRTGTRVKSIFIGPNNSSSSKGIDSPQWNTSTPPMPSMPPANLHATRTVPVTPPEQTDRLSAPRQQSTESIKVYSPPNMLGISSTNIDRNTTFSEVMEKAGFQNTKGQPTYRLTETPVHGQSPLRSQNPPRK